jgi:acyl carrier protein
MTVQQETQLEECITEILREYSQASSLPSPLKPSLSLRDDLAIESLSLVSVVLRLGDILGVDVVDSGFELHTLDTVGSLMALGKKLQISKLAN